MEDAEDGPRCKHVPPTEGAGRAKDNLVADKVRHDNAHPALHVPHTDENDRWRGRAKVCREGDATYTELVDSAQLAPHVCRRDLCNVQPGHDRCHADAQAKDEPAGDQHAALVAQGCRDCSSQHQDVVVGKDPLAAKPVREDAAEERPKGGADEDDRDDGARLVDAHRDALWDEYDCGRDDARVVAVHKGRERGDHGISVDVPREPQPSVWRTRLLLCSHDGTCASPPLPRRPLPFTRLLPPRPQSNGALGRCPISGDQPCL